MKHVMKRCYEIYCAQSKPARDQGQKVETSYARKSNKLMSQNVFIAEERSGKITIKE